MKPFAILLLVWMSSAQSAQSQPSQPPAGAVIETTLFRYSRKIPQSARAVTDRAYSGWSDLQLDAAVLAHSRPDLGDLRIVDSTNRQIPYLLEKRPEAVVLDLPLSPDKAASSAAQSHYQIVLPSENLPAAKLIISTNETLFQRKVSIQVKRFSDRRSDPALETVANGNWHHTDSDTPAPLVLDLPPFLGTSTVTLIVEEGDNRPLPLSGARLELPHYSLRFFYPADGTLSLLYGQDTLAAPRYDLELLAPKLAELTSNEVHLDQEHVTPAAVKNTVTQERVFWAALVAAVIGILILLVRLLPKAA